MTPPPPPPASTARASASAALRGGDWTLRLGEPVAFDPAGPWFAAEVQVRRGRGGDARVHLLDDAGLAIAAVVEQLREACGHHAWLDLPDLVPLRALVQHDGRVAVVSDPWPAARLAQVVGEVPVPPRAAGELTSRVADALHGLHTASAPGSIRPAGLVHGGLDLDTILLARDGRVGLLEAGLAPALRARGGPATSHAFLAPEARGDAPIDAAADIYACCMLLVACLSGRPPEPLPADPDEHARAVDATLAALFDLDGQVAELLRLGLSFDPALRPSARELSARVQAALPRMGGRWLTAWAGDVIPEPGPHRPLLVEEVEEETGELPPGATASASVAPESLRPLRKAAPGGPGGFDARRALGTLAGALGAAALLAFAAWLAVPIATRWWVDNHGEMDMEDVPTELDGPPEAEADVVVVSEDDLARGPGEAPPDPSVVGRPAAVVVVPGSDEPAEPAEEEKGVFALATPDASGPELDTPEPEPVARPIRVVPPPVIPAALEADEPAWGTDWEEVDPRTPLVDIRVDVPMAEQVSVVCANGVTGHGTSSVSLQPHLGRCDVRANGPGGVQLGSFKAEESRAFTCRLEFLDQLRCR